MKIKKATKRAVRKIKALAYKASKKRQARKEKEGQLRNWLKVGYVTTKGLAKEHYEELKGTPQRLLKRIATDLSALKPQRQNKTLHGRKH